MLHNKITCESCGSVLAYGPTCPEVTYLTLEGEDAPEVPAFLLTTPPAALLTVQRLVQIGLGLQMLGVGRRSVVHALQLRLEYYLDAGGLYRTHDFESFPIDESSVERTFPANPEFAWISSTIKRARQGTVREAPGERLLDRLTILDLALRTPPLGEAI